MFVPSALFTASRNSTLTSAGSVGRATGCNCPSSFGSACREAILVREADDNFVHKGMPRRDTCVNAPHIDFRHFERRPRIQNARLTRLADVQPQRRRCPTLSNNRHVPPTRASDVLEAHVVVLRILDNAAREAEDASIGRCSRGRRSRPFTANGSSR
jgi:hypothetical protein